jgi:uncharacterized protein YndB with AHSA1/START domain
VININSSTFIYRPIKQVFEFISTPENDFQWQYGTLTSARISEGDAKVGTAFQSIGHLLGYRTQSTYEVTEYEPNKKYGFKSLSGPLQSFTSYTFNIAKGCTQVDLSMQANAVNLIEFNENVLEKKMKKQVKENLKILKNILESE